MKLYLIREANFSRRSFLRGAGKAAGMLATSNPLKLAKTLTKVPSGDFDVMAYGASLFNALTSGQKNALSDFMFETVNNFNPDNVRQFRNIDLRPPVDKADMKDWDKDNTFRHFYETNRKGGYVVKDGMVQLYDAKGPVEGFESFPIDAIFGQYSNFTDPDSISDFFQTYLSGDRTTDFMEKVLPGSVGSIFNKFVDKLGIEGVSDAIRDAASDLGTDPTYFWFDMINTNPKLQSMLGVSDVRSAPNAIKAVHQLVNKGLLNKEEVAPLMARLSKMKPIDLDKQAADYEKRLADTDKNIAHNRQIHQREQVRRREDIKRKKEEAADRKREADNREADKNLAHPMHQPFESKLNEALEKIGVVIVS